MRKKHHKISTSLLMLREWRTVPRVVFENTSSSDSRSDSPLEISRSLYFPANISLLLYGYFLPLEGLMEEFCNKGSDLNFKNSKGILRLSLLVLICTIIIKKMGLSPP